MNKIKSSEIKIGMKFTAPVFFDDGLNMFLAEKKPITAFHTNALSRWKIPYVITYGKVISDEYLSKNTEDELEELDEIEELEEVDQFQSKFIEPTNKTLEIIADNLSQIDKDIISIYTKTLKSLSVFFTCLKNNNTVSRTDLDTLIETIYSLVFPQNLIAISIVMTTTSESEFAQTALNCAILSANLALHVGLSKSLVQQLIAASLLHDVGMLSTSEQVLQKKSPLSEGEYNMIKLHPTRSSRFASDTLFFPNDVAIIIQQHHECWDGSGYPKGLHGDKIEYSARILAITDAFSAMISKKSYRDSLLGYEAIKNLMEDKEKHFDPEILHSFVNMMGIYPLGTIVKLNDNSIGQVIEPNNEMPFMPTIKILKDNIQSNFQIGDVIALKEKRFLCISKVLKPDEFQISA